MKNKPYVWIIGLLVTLVVIIVPVAIFLPQDTQAAEDPWANVAPESQHTDHSHIVQGVFTTGQEVTPACLECHPDSATEVMHTTHWTWESQPFDVPWRDEPVTIGKINQINNFCIGSQGNEKKCMSCHVGYGWEENEDYDFANADNVDCLACHADTGKYAKGDYGNPQKALTWSRAQACECRTARTAENAILTAAVAMASSMATWMRACISPENLDVHMGGDNFLCTDCHQTKEHEIKAALLRIITQMDPTEQVACTDCHASVTHEDERINTHPTSVACQTCHVPSMAIKNPTKTYWDWSTAGQDRPEDHYTYLKIKGSFIYEKDVKPTYMWFNGNWTTAICWVTRSTHLTNDITLPRAISRSQRKISHSNSMSPNSLMIR